MSRYARALASVYPVLFGGRKYSRSLLSLFGSSIVAYWPLWEASGSVAYDISGNGRNGSYTGVTLGQPGIGDGHTCPQFDGANDYANVYSASLNTAFPRTAGSILMWAKVSAAGVWTDGTLRRLFDFFIDGNNFLILARTATNNQMQLSYRANGAATENIITSAYPLTTWLHLAGTWDSVADEFKFYVNANLIDTTTTIGGALTGNLSSVQAVLGATSTVPSGVWDGYLAHALLLDRAATPAEIAMVASL